MKTISDHWAIFVEGTEIRWTFGDPSAEFQKIVLNFLLGLGNLGEEIFGEGIASITFDLQKHSGMKASEIFIVSLQDQFLLIVSDPATTLLLITIQGGIPVDIKEMMTAVLVGQASILYANSITDLNPKERKFIEKKFQNIILDINDKYNDSIQTIVGKSGTNFSILTFEECLLLHFYLRKQIVPTDYLPSGERARCLISQLGGGPIPFSFNIGDDLVMGGYFAAIIEFISTLFGTKPKYISFGSTTIRRVRFVYGGDYFMAIDASFMIDLLLKRQFQKQFFETNYSIIKDMSTGIKELIIEEIIQFTEKKLNELSLGNLLNTYIGEGSEDLELSFGTEREKGKEVLELLREERMDQVLRVWGRYLVNL
ncbi:MAG: hypothetical protein JSU57_00420 [Candidatus Heimdallarchaeota archaeon]|nr:MAG: hypothetical protein JSU57_00420 [Candidatus Heimdallarchaeota archaeon]